MKEHTIFTLNARDNCILEILNQHTSYKEINSEISRLFEEIKNILKKKI